MYTLAVAAHPRSFREWLLQKGAQSNAVALEQYVGWITDEDWRSEFKLAASGTDFQARRAIAALANARGGELFLGVREDREIEGTLLQPTQLTQVLRQASAPGGDWFLVDLNLVADQTTVVDLGRENKRAFVIETGQPGIPVFVHRDDGRLVFFIRERNTVTELTGFEAIVRYREQNRTELLRELFTEFETGVARIADFPPYDLGQFELPRLERARQDGSFYRFLTQADQVALVGGGQQGNPTGILTRFEGIGHKIREWQARGISYNQMGNNVRVERELSRNDLGQLRDYLRRERILPPA